IYPRSTSTLFPYTTLFRSQFFFELGKIDISPGSGLGFRIRQLLVLAIWNQQRRFNVEGIGIFVRLLREQSYRDKSKKRGYAHHVDRKSTRLNSSHGSISYA